MSLSSRAIKLLIHRYAGVLKGLCATRIRRLREALSACLRGSANLLRTKAAACLVAGLAATAAAGTAPAQDPPPNVIYMMADDLGWADNSLPHNRAYAQQRGDTDTFFETPNLERLALSGVTFTEACAPGTNCSPTRVSMLAGQHTARHRTTTISNSDSFYGGEYNVRDYERNLSAATVTSGEALRAAGYRTAHVGKWHVGEEGNPAADPTQNGFDTNLAGGPFGAPQQPDQYFAAGDGSFTFNTDSGTPVQVLPANGNGGQYLTDRLADEATQLITDAHNAGEPIFMNFWTYGVHTPLQAPSALVNKYQNKLNTGIYAKFDSLGSEGKHDVATYAAMVESVDAALGAVLDRLEDPDADGDTSDSIADNTLVVFASDHGGFNQDRGHYHAAPDMNGPLREGKGAPYEGGLRVTTVAGGAGVNHAGATLDTAIVGADWYPTFLSMAGAPGSGNAEVDGTDISALLDGSATTVNRDQPMVWHVPHLFGLDGTANSGNPMSPFSAIREGNHKLIRYYRQTGLTEVELYDLSNDIGEANDLAASNQGMVTSLSASLDAYLGEVDAQMPTGHELDRTGPPPLWADLFDHQPDTRDVDSSVSGQFGALESLPLREDGSDNSAEARVAGSELLLGDSADSTGWIAPDHSFTDQAILDAGGFTVSFDVNPIVGGNGSDSRWAAVSVGHSRLSAIADPSTLKFNGQSGNGEFVVVHEDLAFGIIFADDGTYAVRDDGTPVDLDGEGDADRLVFDPAPAGQDKTYHVELIFDTDSFAMGAPAVASCFVDSVQIDLNGVDAAGLDYAFTWNTGENYLNFEAMVPSSGFGHSMMDNIVVDAVPEPATLSLLAVGGLGVLRRRHP